MRSSTAPVLRPVPNRSLGRGARATLAMGLVPILAAGCGAASSAGSRQSTARQTASTEVADSTLTGGAAPRCHTSELGASTLNSTGAAGTIGVTFRLANTSQRACRLAGFVGMQMLDVAGRPPFDARHAQWRLPLHPSRCGALLAAAWRRGHFRTAVRHRPDRVRDVRSRLAAPGDASGRDCLAGGCRHFGPGLPRR
jgi:hypothetical protein